MAFVFVLSEPFKTLKRGPQLSLKNFKMLTSRRESAATSILEYAADDSITIGEVSLLEEELPAPVQHPVTEVSRRCMEGAVASCAGLSVRARPPCEGHFDVRIH